MAGGQARLSVPTRFLKSWIDTHYLGHLTTVLAAEVDRLASIVIVVRSSACPDIQAFTTRSAQGELLPEPQAELSHKQERFAPLVPRAAARLGSPAPMDALVSSPLDRRLTFSTFHVGRANQLAFSAAQRVAEDVAAAPGVQPAIFPLLCRPGQDPSSSGHRACGDRQGARRLSDGRKIHVWVRRGLAGADPIAFKEPCGRSIS